MPCVGSVQESAQKMERQQLLAVKSDSRFGNLQRQEMDRLVREVSAQSLGDKHTMKLGSSCSA